MLIAYPPDVIRWHNRTPGVPDCAVVALATACGVSYESALGAVLPVAPNVLKDGLTNAEMKKAAAALGFKGRVLRKFDLDDDSGILSVVQPHVPGSEHCVYLWEGRILEPNANRQQMWLHATDYLAHYKYLATHLLVLSRRK